MTDSALKLLVPDLRYVWQVLDLWPFSGHFDAWTACMSMILGSTKGLY